MTKPLDPEIRARHAAENLNADAVVVARTNLEAQVASAEAERDAERARAERAEAALGRIAVYPNTWQAEKVRLSKAETERIRRTPGPAGHPICGIVVGSSWHEPVACAYPPGHDGDHSWASIPALAPLSAREEQK